MRLTQHQIDTIRAVVDELAGPQATVRLFGSRLDDDVRGGDIDLLVEMPEAVARPAMLGSHLAARLERRLNGRKLDVVLLAPNLKRLPIHETALREGQKL